MQRAGFGISLAHLYSLHASSQPPPSASKIRKPHHLLPIHSYIATAVLSEILTNNAAGAVMYPIAATAADELGIDPKYMSIAIMMGASAGFINPFSE